MSNTNLCQNCHKKVLNELYFDGNKELSRTLLEQLQNHYKNNVVKHLAHELNISVDTVRNWIYRGTGLKAYDLLLLLNHYACIRDFLGFKKIFSAQKITGKNNRKEMCKKMLDLLINNPEMTINELAYSLKITPKTVEWMLYTLVQRKRIERVGSTKKGKWIVHA